MHNFAPVVSFALLHSHANPPLALIEKICVVVYRAVEAETVAEEGVFERLHVKLVFLPFST